MNRRGGYRAGAGRPKGTGRYQEPTQPIRVPTRLIPEIKTWLEDTYRGIPLFGARLAAGSPCLTEDFVDDYINLHAYLIPHPDQIFYIRASGDSMVRSGIHHHDLLIVDRSLKPLDGKIVVAIVHETLMIKRFHQQEGIVRLISENPVYSAIEFDEVQACRILGVVLHVIHSFGR